MYIFFHFNLIQNLHFCQKWYCISNPRHPHRMNYGRNSNEKLEEEEGKNESTPLVCKKGKKRENELH